MSVCLFQVSRLFTPGYTLPIPWDPEVGTPCIPRRIHRRRMDFGEEGDQGTLPLDPSVPPNPDDPEEGPENPNLVY